MFCRVNSHEYQSTEAKVVSSRILPVYTEFSRVKFEPESSDQPEHDVLLRFEAFISWSIDPLISLKDRTPRRTKKKTATEFPSTILSRTLTRFLTQPPPYLRFSHFVIPDVLGKAAISLRLFRVLLLISSFSRRGVSRKPRIFLSFSKSLTHSRATHDAFALPSSTGFWMV